MLTLLLRLAQARLSPSGLLSIAELDSNYASPLYLIVSSLRGKRGTSLLTSHSIYSLYPSLGAASRGDHNSFPFLASSDKRAEIIEMKDLLQYRYEVGRIIAGECCVVRIRRNRVGGRFEQDHG